MRHILSCKSKNVIYLITCSKCNKQHVGLTTCQLNSRISRHRSSIIRKLPIYICKHFNLQDHSLNNLTVQPIDSATSLEQLQRLEKFWIATLQTLQPTGLNVSKGRDLRDLFALLPQSPMSFVQLINLACLQLSKNGSSYIIKTLDQPTMVGDPAWVFYTHTHTHTQK